MKPPFRHTLLLFAATACGDRPAGEDSPLLHATVRDSADVRIIENPRPPTGTRLDWRIGSEPEVTIGEVEGAEPYLLARVSDALVLADGRIVVANGGSHELRVFDASGYHVATWGRRGEGPGEFTNLSQVHRWPGDSLLALYSQARHLSVLDSSGNFGRSFTLQRGWAFFTVESVSATGAILSSDFVRPGNRPVGFSRLPSHYRVRGPEGETRSSLGSFPGPEMFAVRTARGLSGGGIPFRHRVSAFAWGDFAAVAQNDTYEIRAFDLDGTLRRIVRRDHELVAPTPAHLDAYIEDRVAVHPEEERPERRAELRESMRDRHVPETHPAYAAAQSDLVDHLWVREYALPGGGDPNPVWTVFDPEGQVLGFMETPAGLSILEIGDDYILGLARDDLGVEYVQVWSLRAVGAVNWGVHPLTRENVNHSFQLVICD